MRKTIIIIILLIFCCSLGAAKNIKLFFNTGGAFAVSPEWFQEDKKPSFVIGGGVGLDLSSKWTIQVSFNYCSFYPKDEYEKWLIVLDSVIDISDWGWYQGDHFDSFYSFMIDTKYFIRKGRLSPYFIGSAGFMLERWVSGGSVIIGQGETLYISLRGGLSVGGGLGVEYRLNRRLSLFMESQYFIFWYKNRDKEVKSRGIVPIRIGVFFNL